MLKFFDANADLFDPGSGIREGKNFNPGSGINTTDLATLGP
jgi:hypothetical protein